ncbi:MAG: MFS transporter [Kouleothrix sp.]|nr:MFS transporter [Kouleothrix sp.]
MDLFSSLTRQGAALARWVSRPASVAQRNVRNVLIDGIGVGLVSGVAAFLSVFLVRLGASPFLVGLLTSMPALTGIVLALPVGRLLERQRNIVPWYSRARVWVLGSYALTGLAPFFFPIELVPIAIIVIWAIATVPQTIVNVAFTVVMGAVAGPDKRYYLMSRRWSVLGLTTAITVALAGWLLEQIRFPINYQAVFIGSFAGGLLSFIFSSRIVIPDSEPDDAGDTRLPWRRRLRESAAAVRDNAPYSRFLLSQFVFRCGLTLSLPLFPLYWVRDLHASDSWIGVITMVNSGVLLAAYFGWAAISQRRGNKIVLLVCAFGLVLYPLLTGLTHSVGPLPIYAGMAGIFGAGIDLVLFDLLLLTCPPRHTASYIALYQMTTYVATFLAPTAGTFLADTFGTATGLFAASALRLAGAALFVLLRVGANPNAEG